MQWQRKRVGVSFRETREEKSVSEGYRQGQESDKDCFLSHPFPAESVPFAVTALHR